MFRERHRFKTDLLRPFSSSFTSLIETPYLINPAAVVVGPPLSRPVYDISPYFITFFRASANARTKHNTWSPVTSYPSPILSHIRKVGNYSTPSDKHCRYAHPCTLHTKLLLPIIRLSLVFTLPHGQLDSAYDTNRTLDTLFCINQFIPQHPLSSLVPSERHLFFRQYNLPVEQNTIPNFAHLAG